MGDISLNFNTNIGHKDISPLTIEQLETLKGRIVLSVCEIQLIIKIRIIEK